MVVHLLWPETPSTTGFLVLLIQVLCLLLKPYGCHCIPFQQLHPLRGAPQPCPQPCPHPHVGGPCRPVPLLPVAFHPASPGSLQKLGPVRAKQKVTTHRGLLPSISELKRCSPVAVSAEVCSASSLGQKGFFFWLGLKLDSCSQCTMQRDPAGSCCGPRAFLGGVCMPWQTKHLLTSPLSLHGSRALIRADEAGASLVFSAVLPTGDTYWATTVIPLSPRGLLSCAWD